MPLVSIQYIIPQKTIALQFYKLYFTIFTMVGGKHNLCVGLTTFDNDMLRISIPALGRVRRKFLLVIHNDNPATIITRRQIHALGYRGDMLIINSEENIGLFRARLEIIRTVAAMRGTPEWIMFADDDDIIASLDMPDNPPDDRYMIIQNTLTIHHRMADVVRAMNDADELFVDGQNITTTRQIDTFAGTIYRIGILIDFINTVTPAIQELENTMRRASFVPPVDKIMRALVDMFAFFVHPTLLPIFMNRDNYIAIKIDSAPNKYGRAARPARNPDAAYTRIIEKCEEIFLPYVVARRGTDE